MSDDPFFYTNKIYEIIKKNSRKTTIEQKYEYLDIIKKLVDQFVQKLKTDMKFFRRGRSKPIKIGDLVMIQRDAHLFPQKDRAHRCSAYNRRYGTVVALRDTNTIVKDEWWVEVDIHRFNKEILHPWATKYRDFYNPVVLSKHLIQRNRIAESFLATAIDYNFYEAVEYFNMLDLWDVFKQYKQDTSDFSDDDYYKIWGMFNPLSRPKPDAIIPFFNKDMNTDLQNGRKFEENEIRILVETNVQSDFENAEILVKMDFLFDSDIYRKYYNTIARDIDTELCNPERKNEQWAYSPNISIEKTIPQQKMTLKLFLHHETDIDDVQRFLTKFFIFTFYKHTPHKYLQKRLVIEEKKEGEGAETFTEIIMSVINSIKGVKDLQEGEGYKLFKETKPFTLNEITSDFYTHDNKKILRMLETVVRDKKTDIARPVDAKRIPLRYRDAYFNEIEFTIMRKTVYLRQFEYLKIFGRYHCTDGNTVKLYQPFKDRQGQLKYRFPFLNKAIDDDDVELFKVGVGILPYVSVVVKDKEDRKYRENTEPMTVNYPKTTTSQYDKYGKRTVFTGGKTVTRRVNVTTDVIKGFNYAYNNQMLLKDVFNVYSSKILKFLLEQPLTKLFALEGTQRQTENEILRLLNFLMYSNSSIYEGERDQDSLKRREFFKVLVKHMFENLYTKDIYSFNYFVTNLFSRLYEVDFEYSSDEEDDFVRDRVHDLNILEFILNLKSFKPIHIQAVKPPEENDDVQTLENLEEFIKKLVDDDQKNAIHALIEKDKNYREKNKAAFIPYEVYHSCLKNFIRLDDVDLFATIKDGLNEDFVSVNAEKIMRPDYMPKAMYSVYLYNVRSVPMMRHFQEIGYFEHFERESIPYAPTETGMKQIINALTRNPSLEIIEIFENMDNPENDNTRTIYLTQPLYTFWGKLFENKLTKETTEQFLQVLMTKVHGKQLEWSSSLPPSEIKVVKQIDDLRKQITRSDDTDNDEMKRRGLIIRYRAKYLSLGPGGSLAHRLKEDQEERKEAQQMYQVLNQPWKKALEKEEKRFIDSDSASDSEDEDLNFEKDKLDVKDKNDPFYKDDPAYTRRNYTGYTGDEPYWKLEYWQGRWNMNAMYPPNQFSYSIIKYTVANDKGVALDYHDIKNYIYLLNNKYKNYLEEKVTTKLYNDVHHFFMFSRGLLQTIKLWEERLYARHPRFKIFALTLRIIDLRKTQKQIQESVNSKNNNNDDLRKEYERAQNEKEKLKQEREEERRKEKIFMKKHPKTSKYFLKYWKHRTLKKENWKQKMKEDKEKIKKHKYNTFKKYVLARHAWTFMFMMRYSKQIKYVPAHKWTFAAAKDIAREIAMRRMGSIKDLIPFSVN